MSVTNFLHWLAGVDPNCKIMIESHYDPSWDMTKPRKLGAFR